MSQSIVTSHTHNYAILHTHIYYDYLGYNFWHSVLWFQRHIVYYVTISFIVKAASKTYQTLNVSIWKSQTLHELRREQLLAQSNVVLVSMRWFKMPDLKWDVQPRKLVSMIRRLNRDALYCSTVHREAPPPSSLFRSSWLLLLCALNVYITTVTEE